MSSLHSAFLLLALLQARPGHQVNLQPPKNVTMFSRNFRVFVSWIPVDGYPPNVSYTVEIQRFDQSKSMLVCTNIIRTECEITCMDVYNEYDKYSARVKAASQDSLSSWEHAKHFDYIEDMELGPPELHVNLMSTDLSIAATVHLPVCMQYRFLNLKYDLSWWKAGTDEHKDYPNNDINRSVIINKNGYSGNYCMSARTTHFELKIFRSAYSEPLCLLLEEKTRWEVLVAMSAVLLLLLLLAAASISLYVYIYKAGNVKTPTALDFAEIRNAPPKQPGNHEESLLEECLVYTTGLRASLPPLLLEEDDTEDDGSIYEEYTERHQAPLGQECTESEADSEGPLTSMSDSEAGSSESLKNLGSSHFVLGDKVQEESCTFQESRDSSDSGMGDLRDPSSCQSREEPFAFRGSLLHRRSPDWSQVFLLLPQLPTGSHNFIMPPAAQCMPAGEGHETQTFLTHQTDEVLPDTRKGICFQTLQLAKDSSQTTCSSCDDGAELAKGTAELTQPVVVGGSFEEDSRAEDIHMDLKAEISLTSICQREGHYMSRNG